jgi:hypothetical protein
MKKLSLVLILIFCFYLPHKNFSQEFIPYNLTYQNEKDKCGYNEALSKSLLKILGDHWGYSYDSLLVDLQKWQQSPYISIDSLGASVQNRALWELTITSATLPVTPRKIVYIHARTHPGEVQSFWVTNEIINILSSESEFAKFVREKCVFYIIPMYNPDGVELEFRRENANGVDIESNWYASVIQPEVAVLRARFTELMWSSAPIEVALNMHSSTSGERYFVYHDAAGTSLTYTELEKQFIGAIQSYFPGGIAPWYYFVSWTNGTPYQYPESWFWLNHQESVMALTYEDVNGPTAGDYDKTAIALLKGATEYLGLDFSTGVAENLSVPLNFELGQNYPNPFNPSTTISYYIPLDSHVSLKIFNLQGEEISTIFSGQKETGTYNFTWKVNNLSSGIYFYQLTAKDSHGGIQYSSIKKATFLK